MAKYAFLPWVRQGLAAAVHAGSGQVGGRVQLPVSAQVTGGSAVRSAGPGSVHLLGPGDVVGLDSAQVIRCEPPPSSAGHETNCFPFVEFSRADLPWMFTPSAAGGERLRPWLCLVVAEQREGVKVEMAQGDRLPVLEIGDNAFRELPDLSEGWAWAHAQVAMADDGESSPQRLADVLAARTGRSLSRLICPRQLDPERSYVACVVPAFLGGVQAGLGLAVDAAAASRDAWTVDGAAHLPSSIRLPIYHHWTFSTGAGGDFESLVAQLQRKRLSPAEAGTRALGLASAGHGLPADADIALEGALSPDGAAVGQGGPSPSFQARLKDLVNDRAGGDVPPVAPPLYGCWHAGQRGLPDPAGRDLAWLRDLNLDPRYRTAAGLGSQVVREQQEALMASAWDQAGAVEEANQLIRNAQLAQAAAQSVHQRIGGLAPADFLLVSSPAQARLRHGGDPVTSRGVVAQSALPSAVVNAPMRRLLRARGKPAKAFALSDAAARHGALSAMARGDLRAAPSFAPPPHGMLGAQAVWGRSACSTDLKNLQQAILEQWSAERLKGIAEKLRMLAQVVFNLTSDAQAKGLITRAAQFLVGAVTLFDKYLAGPSTGATVRDLYAPACLRLLYAIWYLIYALLLLAGVRNPFLQLALRPLRAKVEEVRADLQAITVGLALCTGGQAFEPCHAPAEPVRASLDLDAFKTVVQVGLDPVTSLPARLGARIDVPEWQPESMETLMVAPDFPAPMYKALAAASQDWLLPGLDKVPGNSLCMVQSNPRFIEAFMVGLNHEMSRELLWRGFPTDQRGSCFRQFWDPSGRFAAPSTEAQRLAQVEQGKDIAPLHTWRTRRLGENFASTTGQIVLLVRGELLRRYPRAEIFLARGEWDAGGQRRDPVAGSAEGTDRRHPLFRGQLAPDVAFFGFGIAAADARGDATAAAQKPGWFLTIQQPPTEPRMGLDSDPPAATPASWGDLAWAHVGTLPNSRHVRLQASMHGFPAAAQAVPAGWAWSAQSDAAQIASIALRRPVRVFIHASELLW